MARFGGVESTIYDSGMVAGLVVCSCGLTCYLPIKRKPLGQNHAAKAVMTTQNENQSLRVSLLCIAKV